MTDVFVSYSRVNKVFAQTLVDALKAANREVWADWHSIPASSEWDAEIKEGIQSSDSVLFVLSPDWRKSAECRKELDYAVAMGKRLIPIMYIEKTPQEGPPIPPIPPELTKIDYIFMRDGDDFEKGFARLCTALDTDLDWVKKHTRLQIRALEWDKKNRDHSFVLRGKDLADGEDFLSKATGKSPEPTKLQGEYILASRKDATQRSRITFAGVSIALVVSIILAVLAFFSRQAAKSAEASAVVERDNAVAAQNTAVAAQETAVANEKEAKRQATISRAGELAALALSEKDDNFDLALLLGLQGYRTLENPRTLGTLLSLTNAQPGLETYLSGHQNSVFSVVYSSDGNRIASGSWDRNIIVWDVRDPSTPSIIATLKGHTRRINSVDINSKRNLLASASSDKTVILWDLSKPAASAQIAKLENYNSSVLSVAFSPDGKILASSSNKTIMLWDITNPATPAQIIAWDDPATVNNVAFSPDGKYLATASNDKTISLWDMSDPKAPSLRATLKGHLSGVLRITFSRDGRYLASGGLDNNVILWDVSNPEKPSQLSTLTGHTRGIYAISFNSDGTRLASGSNDATIRLWDISDPTVPKQLTLLQTNGVWSVAFSPNGKQLVSGNRDNTLIIWNVSDPKPPSQIAKLEGLSSDIDSIALSPDGLRMASTGYKTITLWDINNPTRSSKYPTLEGHDDWVRSVAFSPDGKYLASGSNDWSVILWDISNPAAPVQRSKMTDHSGAVNSVAISPNGKYLASGSNDRSVILWDISNPAAPIKLARLKGHLDSVISVAFNPDSTLLASGSGDYKTILWDISDPAHPIQRSALEGHLSAVYSVAFSPDGKQLASASSDTTVILWDVSQPSTPAKLATLTGHFNTVDTVAFSSDGKQLASGSHDKTINLWDISNPTLPFLLATLSGHNDFVNSIAFRPKQMQLVSGSNDNTIVFWDLDVNSWIKKACQRAGRNLTRAEWAQYLSGQDYQKTCEQWPLESEPTVEPLASTEPAATPVTASGTNTLFKDDFSDNTRWSTFSSSHDSVEYDNGTLRMQVHEGSWIVWSTPGDDTYKNIHIETTVFPHDDNISTAFGLMCYKQPDLSSYYYVAIDKDGGYAIARATDNENDVYLTNNDNWVYSDLIETNKSSYRLGMDCGNGLISLYVDGKMIDSVTDSTYTSGGVGLFSWNYKKPSDVTFDDFVVTKLK